MSLFDKINRALSSMEKLKDDINFSENREPIRLYDSNGAIVYRNDFITRFNFDKLKEIDNHYYLLLNENIPIAIDDLLYVNTFIIQAPHLHPCFPIKRINADKLSFIPKNKTLRDYCVISFNPKTEKGNKPKYPVVLHFYYDKELFGDVFYGKDGEICRVEIVAWENNICRELIVSMNGENLEIDKIYKHNPLTGKKQKMFFR